MRLFRFERGEGCYLRLFFKFANKILLIFNCILLYLFSIFLFVSVDDVEDFASAEKVEELQSNQGDDGSDYEDAGKTTQSKKEKKRRKEEKKKLKLQKKQKEFSVQAKDSDECDEDKKEVDDLEDKLSAVTITQDETECDGEGSIAVEATMLPKTQPKKKITKEQRKKSNVDNIECSFEKVSRILSCHFDFIIHHLIIFTKYLRFAVTHICVISYIWYLIALL